MNKAITHIRRWNEWRKYNRNSKFYQLLVLTGFISSPTYWLTLLPEETEQMRKEILQ